MHGDIVGWRDAGRLGFGMKCTLRNKGSLKFCIEPMEGCRQTGMKGTLRNKGSLGFCMEPKGSIL